MGASSSGAALSGEPTSDAVAALREFSSYQSQLAELEAQRAFLNQKLQEIDQKRAQIMQHQQQALAKAINSMAPPVIDPSASLLSWPTPSPDRLDRARFPDSGLSNTLAPGSVPPRAHETKGLVRLSCCDDKFVFFSCIDQSSAQRPRRLQRRNGRVVHQRSTARIWLASADLHHKRAAAFVFWLFTIARALVVMHRPWRACGVLFKARRRPCC